MKKQLDCNPTASRGQGMINAVIYARFSSSSQREESIDTQIRECMDYANRHNMVVLRTYQDRAKSGRTANRPSFLKMIKDAEDHKFQAVLLYTLDRFARNRFDAAYYKAKLKEQGVSIFYVKQDLGEGPEFILLESVMEGMAEYYSASLSRSVKAGMTENALHCKYNGGILPLGYGVDEEHNIIEIPEEAAIVKKIFTMYNNGYSKTEIAAYLNDHGHRTKRGEYFKPGTFDKILSNERYKGIYIHSNYRVEGGIPAIIDEQTWFKAQLRIKEVTKMRAKYKAEEIYLLTPKVFCGCCGQPMYGETGTSRNGETYHYYKCVTRKKHLGECTKRTERKEQLEATVIQMIEDQILVPDMIDEIAKQCADLMENDLQRDPEYIGYKARLEELERALKNGWKAVENGLNSSEFMERLNNHAKEKMQIEKEIRILESCHKPLTASDIAFFLEQFKLKNLKLIDYDRFICQSLISKVILNDRQDGTFITVFCNISDKNKKPEPVGSDYNAMVEQCVRYPNTLQFLRPEYLATGGYYKPD